ncbi:ABC transporter permease [Magnetococcus sp. PR-3]|uniref:ABC transporter permease n=1 Tax=Magnetococcus sp. PR-3 TaxID=3120355 RepID=UPI002FCE0CA4
MSGVLVTPLELGLAALLVLAMAGSSVALQLNIGRRIIIAAIRTAIQLTLLGLVLKTLFAQTHWGWVAVMGMVMLLAAGREATQRQSRRFSGWWSFGIGLSAMFVSSFVITLLVLWTVVTPTPWYTPQYAIPLLGITLGNTLNGIALGLDRLTQGAWQNRLMIETRLASGEPWPEALLEIKREAVRTGTIPMLNAMAAAGIVSLPGMMTGQILAGADPVQAVNYQILIMFMVSAGSGFGTMLAVHMGAKRLFDERHRLRLDRLGPGNA